MSVSISLIKFKDLAWGADFAGWLVDKVACGSDDGNFYPIQQDDFDREVKKLKPKFKKDNAEQIRDLSMALQRSKYGSITIFVSW